MKHSRLARRVVVGIGLALTLATSALPVQAFAIGSEESVSLFNNKDEGYGFNFSGRFQRADTRWRRKDNNTSFYIKVSSAKNNPMRLYANGADSSNGRNAENVTDGANKWVVSPGAGEYEIHNSVNERRHSYASLGASSDYGKASLSGVWSPDCVGHFSVLNVY